MEFPWSTHPLKNQGYEMGHNFGHGHDNLCTNFGILMMLAFLIDQLAELADVSFQKARRAGHSYRALWGYLKFAFIRFEFENWKSLWDEIESNLGYLETS